MSESDRKHVDGCAIFYKTEKYELHSSCVNELIWTVVLLLLPAWGGSESQGDPLSSLVYRLL